MALIPVMRYRGDGRPPAGSPPVSRGESGTYLADAALVSAVNAAIAVQQPLLVTGEPGTGKTTLAWSIASELGLAEPLVFHTRSDSQARDVLYTFDSLMRFYDAQISDPRARQPEAYVRLEALGEAIASATQRVVLIDEVDKASRDFPNDLLNEIDQMSFTVREIGRTYRAAAGGLRPIVVITSNSERQLPEPFLRRCVFHDLHFPTADHLAAILRERLRYLEPRPALIAAAVQRFIELRNLPHLERRAATSELVLWVGLLIRAGITEEHILSTSLRELPFPELLVKTRSDRASLQAS